MPTSRKRQSSYSLFSNVTEQKSKVCTLLKSFEFLNSTKPSIGQVASARLSTPKLTQIADKKNPDLHNYHVLLKQLALSSTSNIKHPDNQFAWGNLYPRKSESNLSIRKPSKFTLSSSTKTTDSESKYEVPYSNAYPSLFTCSPTKSKECAQKHVADPYTSFEQYLKYKELGYLTKEINDKDKKKLSRILTVNSQFLRTVHKAVSLVKPKYQNTNAR